MCYHTEQKVLSAVLLLLLGRHDWWTPAYAKLTRSRLSVTNETLTLKTLASTQVKDGRQNNVQENLAL